MKRRFGKIIRKILLINTVQIRFHVYNYETAENRGYHITPPLGLMYLASAFLKDKDYDVELYDTNLELIRKIKDEKQTEITRDNIREFCNEMVKEKIRSFSPDVVGISCIHIPFYSNAHDLCRTAKEVNPEIITVIGGHYTNHFYEMALEDNCLDYVVLSESDFSFRDLIRHLNGELEWGEMDGVATINGGYRFQPKKKYVENINEIPFPAWHMVDLADYEKYGRYSNRGQYFGTTANFCTSRGCPLKCSYCASPIFWGKEIRYRSPENVVEELKILKEKYGVKQIMFEDDNLTFKKERAIKLFELMIKENLDLKWCANNGVYTNSLDDELIEMMVKSGCYRVTLGIESGNEEVLRKLIHKPTKLDKARNVVKSFRRYPEVFVSSFFIFGYPYETKRQMRDTYEFAEELQLDWGAFNVVNPLPGTEIHDICVKEKYCDSTKLDFNNLGTFMEYASITTPEFNPIYVTSLASEANYRLNYLENVMLKGRNKELAIWAFKHVARIVPEHALTNYCLGHAYFNNGEIQNSVSALMKTSDLLRKHEWNREVFKKYDINVDDTLEGVRLGEDRFVSGKGRYSELPEDLIEE